MALMLPTSIGSARGTTTMQLARTICGGSSRRRAICTTTLAGLARCLPTSGALAILAAIAT